MINNIIVLIYCCDTFSSNCPYILQFIKEWKIQLNLNLFLQIICAKNMSSGPVRLWMPKVVAIVAILVTSHVSEPFLFYGSGLYLPNCPHNDNKWHSMILIVWQYFLKFIFNQYSLKDIRLIKKKKKERERTHSFITTS